jgi:hypothetical protein
MGQFRVRVGDPGRRVRVRLGGQAEQGVADDDAGVVIGDMRELQRAGDVADREHALVRGAQAPIDRDAAVGVGDAGLIEAKVIHGRTPARRDEQVRPDDLHLRARRSRP